MMRPAARDILVSVGRGQWAEVRPRSGEARMAKAKTRTSNAGVYLFRRYAIPPSALHEFIQAAAKQAGWIPPWEQKQSHGQKSAAGTRSGQARKRRVDIRRHYVKVAFERLKPANRRQPYSDQSIDALKHEYRSLFVEDGQDPDLLMSAAPFKADRETLIKDLKALGIRSKARVQRSG
jgi:hypothetical protein